MRTSIICAALLSAVSLSGAALAIDVKTGAFVSTSDGKRIGRVYEVEKAKDGTQKSIAIIRDNRIIHINISTLTAGEKGLTTSLSSDDIKKMN